MCDNDEFTWKGTGLKYAVTMTCDGFDMDTDDWEITVIRGNDQWTYTSENSIQDDNGQWYICVDTAALTSGDMYIVFDASVPDEDFEDGIRHEVQQYYLTNIRNTKKK